MTKTGDKGTTGIFGGERVPKDDPRIEANGAMDELNAHLGLIRAHISPDDPRHRFYGEVQMRIMQAMSLIATRSERRGENPNHFDLNVGRRPGDGDGTSDGRNTRQWFLHPSWRDGSLG